MSNLKERWGVTSNFQLILIIIVFSLNGSFATWIAKPALKFLDCTQILLIHGYFGL